MSVWKKMEKMYAIEIAVGEGVTIVDLILVAMFDLKLALILLAIVMAIFCSTAHILFLMLKLKERT